MSEQQEEHNEWVRERTKRDAAMNRIYGSLPPEDIDAIVNYLRTRGGAETMLAQALDMASELSPAAREALRTAEAEGFLDERVR